MTEADVQETGVADVLAREADLGMRRCRWRGGLTRFAGRASSMNSPTIFDLDHDAAIARWRPATRASTGGCSPGLRPRGSTAVRYARADSAVGECDLFPTAAAAHEAGFRPCLRCRPETSPDLGAWRGASNTVSRALALVGWGRWMRGRWMPWRAASAWGAAASPLFQQHLGASPIACAKPAGAAVAKQLIHETRLPMTEIAMAAGFGSLRRSMIRSRRCSSVRRRRCAERGDGCVCGGAGRDCAEAAVSTAL